MHDFGKAAFGTVRVTLEGRAGTPVALYIGEVLKAGRLDREPGLWRCFKRFDLVLEGGVREYRFVIPPHSGPRAGV